MTDFTEQDLTGARFYNVELTDAHFERVTFEGARLHNVYLDRVRMTGAEIPAMEISGEVLSLRVNGVEVASYVEAELDKRYPERTKMKPDDPAGFREAWDVIERLWAGTVEKYRALPPEKLHERVQDEWTFVENLRHLVFATDSWIKRMLLGDPAPYSPLDLPHDNMEDRPSVPRDRTARPSLDEVLALRADRMATVRKVIEGLTDERLAEMAEPPDAPGYPDFGPFPVKECLSNILNEEFMHRLYVERNLAALTERG